jgi:Zn ribbon nucleic-acid-binding protein
MGMAKRQMEAEQERGFRSIGGYVCSACIDEDFVEAFVCDNAQMNECDFCGREEDHPIAADADDVAELIMAGISSEWCDPVHELGWDSREGGYQGEMIDGWDLLAEVDEPIRGDEFRETLIGSLHSHLWCKRDYAAPHLDEAFQDDWEEFVHRVKHESRFFFPLHKVQWPDPGQARTALELLQGIAVLTEQAGLLVTLPQGVQFWRLRPHNDQKSYTTAADLGTATPDKAFFSNRMSPAGIPAFYGAESLDTALAEVRANKNPDKPLWSGGQFETTQACTVLDLVDLPDPPSLFDPERRHLRRPIFFLSEFAKEISKPLEDRTREHIDYVPTQVVSEYLRLTFEPESMSRVRGVRYRSAQDPDGTNVALFVDSEHCSEDPPDDGELHLRLSAVEHGSM